MGQAPNHDENLHVPCADYCSAAWGWRMSGTTRVSTVRRVEKATFPEAARSLAANWPGRISGPREPVKRSFDRKLVLTFSRAGDGSLTGLASEPLNSPNLSYVRGPHNSARPFWVLPPNAPLHHGAQSRQGILRQFCPYHAKNSPRRLGQPSPVIAELCRAVEATQTEGIWHLGQPPDRWTNLLESDPKFVNAKLTRRFVGLRLSCHRVRF